MGFKTCPYIRYVARVSERLTLRWTGHGIPYCYRVDGHFLGKPYPIGRRYRGRNSLEKKEGSVESEASPYKSVWPGAAPSAATATASS